jgi:hypothetical protein
MGNNLLKIHKKKINKNILIINLNKKFYKKYLKL